MSGIAKNIMRVISSDVAIKHQLSGIKQTSTSRSVGKSGVDMARTRRHIIKYQHRHQANSVKLRVTAAPPSRTNYLPARSISSTNACAFFARFGYRDIS